ncbi:hypothetical protein [Enterobacter phage vB_EclS_AS5]
MEKTRFVVKQISNLRQILFFGSKKTCGNRL